MIATLNNIDSIVDLRKNTPNSLMLSCHVSPTVSSLIKLRALVDTGAQDCSYISQRLASNLEELGLKGSSTHRRVCGGLTDTCMIFNQQFSFDLIFMHEILKINHSIRLENVVAITSPFDLIIGLPDIRKFRLYDVIPSFLGWAGDSNIVMSPPLNVHEQLKERGDIVSSSITDQYAGVDTHQR